MAEYSRVMDMPRAAAKSAEFGAFGSSDLLAHSTPREQVDYEQQAAQAEPKPRIMQQEQPDTTNHHPNSVFGVYQIPLFTIFNPKSATISFDFDCKSSSLVVKMAPAIPGNPAINAHGPVPKGAKVYDYSRVVISKMTDVDVIDFCEFLRYWYRPDMCIYIPWLVQTNQLLNDLMQYVQSCNDRQDVINGISDAVNNIRTELNHLTPADAKGSFGIYRRTPEGDKAWMFNHDENTNMLHINCNMGRNKDTAIRMSISATMAVRLLNVIESFVQSYVSAKVTSTIACGMAGVSVN